MFDTEAIKASVDILALVESKLGPYSNKYGRLHQWHCPFHGEKTPSFTVYSNTQSWYCFGCGKGGNAIDFVMAYRRLDFKKTCRYLEEFSESQPPVQVPRPPVSRERIPPVTDTWQRSALALVTKSEKNLWSHTGADALAYLRQRGFSGKTIHDARLGYNIEHREQKSDWGMSRNGYDDYVSIINGIVIPFLHNGIPQRITIRKFPTAEDETQKYKVLPDSANMLYNSDLLNPSRPAILTEGVFDALSVQQEAGDLIVSVATDGTSGARTQEWIDKLAALPLVLVAYDADTPGDDASAFWLKTLPNSKRWRPLLDDPNAMLEKGLNTRQWVADGLH